MIYIVISTAREKRWSLCAIVALICVACGQSLNREMMSEPCTKGAGNFGKDPSLALGMTTKAQRWRQLDELTLPFSCKEIIDRGLAATAQGSFAVVA